MLVGAPAVAGCVAMTIGALDFQHAAAPDDSHMLSVHTYGIAGLLTDAGVGLDHMFGFFAGFAAWLLAALAVLALIVALVAVLIYLVGRGVGRKALWARIVGGPASRSALALMKPHRLRQPAATPDGRAAAGDGDRALHALDADLAVQRTGARPPLADTAAAGG